MDKKNSCIILYRIFAFHITLRRTRKRSQKVTFLSFGQRSLFPQAIGLTLSAGIHRTELPLRESERRGAHRSEVPTEFHSSWARPSGVTGEKNLVWP